MVKSKTFDMNLKTLAMLLGVLAIAASYVLIPQIVPFQYAWGWEHFSTSPEGMILLLPPSIVLFSVFVYVASRMDRGSLKGWIIRVGLFLSVGGGTWYFRLNNSLGDRDIFLQMLTHGHYFRMSQPMTTAIYALAYDVVSVWDWPPQNAIAIVCSGAALIATEILIGLLSRFTNNVAFATCMILVPCSIIVLFFGYIETSVLALTFQLLFIFLAWKYLDGSEPFWKPALALGLAVACHGLSVYLVPSLFYLGFMRRNDNLNRKQYLKRLFMAIFSFLLPPTVIVCIAVINQELIRGSLVGDSLGGADMRPFVPLFSPASSNERYLIFAWEHFIDLLNLMVLISPFVLVILVFSFVYRKAFLKTSWMTFLAISMLGGLGFAFIWNPDLGMKNDWDLFGPFLVPVFFVGGNFFANKLKSITLVGIALFTAVNSALFIQSLTPIAAWSPSISALPVPDIQHQTNLVWEEKFELIGFDAHPIKVLPTGTEVSFTLYFRGLQQMPVGYTPFLHLVDEQGNVIDQDDHQPYPPTEYWPPGRINSSIFTLTIPDNMDSQKSLEVRMGTYFWQTLERLELSNNGQAVHNNIITLTDVGVK